MTLPLRPLPCETIDGLRPGRADYPYFAHADAVPFEPEATALSWANASWLADASLLVYGSPEMVASVLERSPLPRLGYRLQWLGPPEESRGFLLERDDARIVVFRGTRLESRNWLDHAEIVVLHQDDLWLDSQFFPAAWRAGGRVHSGFLQAFAATVAHLDAALAATSAEDRPVWLVGHSLGGALATLATAHLGLHRVQGLYTMGGPRVGDPSFARVLPTVNHYRFVHREDWVATLPPEILGYVHAGMRVEVPNPSPRDVWGDLLSGYGEVTGMLAELTRTRRLDTGRLPVLVSGLADHMPEYYATLIWNTLARSRESPPPEPIRAS